MCIIGTEADGKSAGTSKQRRETMKLDIDDTIEGIIKAPFGAVVIYKLGGIVRGYYVTENRLKDKRQHAPALIHEFADIVRERLDKLPEGLTRAVELYSKKATIQ